MKDRPILFSGPMVRAILDGRKTQTRRIVKPQPFKGRTDDDVRAEMIQRGALGQDESLKDLVNSSLNAGFIEVQCPYGQPGDRLWVRETYTMGARPIYRASDPGDGTVHIAWKPSIFMPRRLCRIVLEVVDVRVERLQSISNDEAKAEGMFVGARSGRWTHDENVDDGILGGPVAAYRELWNAINGKRARWTDNPWVWVVEFKKVN